MAGLEENIHIVIIVVIILAILLYTMYVIIAVYKRKARIRDANREIALLKMDLLSKQAHLENLIADAVEWTDRDLETYDRTLEDTKILKGKLDKGMDISDIRTKRLELGNETNELFATMEKIKSYEDRLFGGKIDGDKG